MWIPMREICMYTMDTYERDMWIPMREICIGDVSRVCYVILYHIDSQHHHQHVTARTLYRWDT